MVFFFYTLPGGWPSASNSSSGNPSDLRPTPPYSFPFLVILTNFPLVLPPLFVSASKLSLPGKSPSTSFLSELFILVPTNQSKKILWDSDPPPKEVKLPFPFSCFFEFAGYDWPGNAFFPRNLIPLFGLWLTIGNRLPLFPQSPFSSPRWTWIPFSWTCFTLLSDLFRPFPPGKRWPCADQLPPGAVSWFLTPPFPPCFRCSVFFRDPHKGESFNCPQTATRPISLLKTPPPPRTFPF